MTMSRLRLLGGAAIGTLTVVAIAVLAATWSNGSATVTADAEPDTTLPKITHGFADGSVITVTPEPLTQGDVAIFTLSESSAQAEALANQFPVARDVVYVNEAEEVDSVVAKVFVFDGPAIAALPDGVLKEFVRENRVIVGLNMTMRDLQRGIGGVSSDMTWTDEGDAGGELRFAALIVGIACDHATIGQYSADPADHALMGTIAKFALCQAQAPEKEG